MLISAVSRSQDEYRASNWNRFPLAPQTWQLKPPFPSRKRVQEGLFSKLADLPQGFPPFECAGRDAGIQVGADLLKRELHLSLLCVFMLLGVPPVAEQFD